MQTRRSSCGLYGTDRALTSLAMTILGTGGLCRNSPSHGLQSRANGVSGCVGAVAYVELAVRVLQMAWDPRSVPIRASASLEVSTERVVDLGAAHNRG